MRIAGCKFLTILFLCVIVATLVLSCSSHEGKILTIWSGGKEGEQITLHDEEKRYIAVEGTRGICRFEIANGRVRMIESPCDDKICIQVGWIEEHGEAICCVSNQVLVTIKVKGKGAYDAISR
ncbi:MAG: NusG domain II-containing protein [bacterium]